MRKRVGAEGVTSIPSLLASSIIAVPRELMSTLILLVLPGDGDVAAEAGVGPPTKDPSCAYVGEPSAASLNPTPSREVVGVAALGPVMSSRWTLRATHSSVFIPPPTKVSICPCRSLAYVLFCVTPYPHVMESPMSISDRRLLAVGIFARIPVKDEPARAL